MKDKMVAKKNISAAVLMMFSWVGSVAALETQAGIELGYRQAELHWSIAGDSTGCCPNVLSELTWSDLRIRQIQADFETGIGQRSQVFGKIGYGQIIKGENQDSDYLGDNKTFEFSRSNNSAEGDLLDLSVGVSVLLFRPVDTSVGRELRIYPMIGYAYHEQNLEMNEGFQTIPATGSFAGLNSTYETEWHGPWLGLALEFELSQSSYFGLEFQHHNVDYSAEANWNLRQDFMHPKSFEHSADGWGNLVEISYHKQVDARWGWGIDLLMENWETEKGKDKTYFADGTVLETQLNEVVFTSWMLSLGFDYHF